MEHHFSAKLALGVGGRVAEDVALAEGDRAHVLHGARVELGDEDLVVLGEWEWLGEQVGEEVEALARHLQDLGDVRLQVSGQGATAEDAELDAIRSRPVERLVRACDEREQVGAEAWRAVEPVARPSVRQRLRGHLPLRADHRPGGRCVDRQPVRGLQVRLVEAREETVSGERLEVRVAVLLPVLGIDETMEPVPGRVEPALVSDSQRHARLEQGGREQDAVPSSVRTRRSTIDGEAADRPAPEVDEERLAGVGEREPERAITPVALIAGPKLEDQVVADVGDARGAVPRFLVGEDVAGGGLGQHRLGHGASGAGKDDGSGGRRV